MSECHDNWWDPDRPAGFRLSFRDAAVIAAAILLWFVLWWFIPMVAGIVPVLLANFFLFCNVFRIGTRRELLWTCVFVANVLVWATLDPLSWWAIALTQTPVTLIVILWAAFGPRYHGIGWQRINPGYTSSYATRASEVSDHGG